MRKSVFFLIVAFFLLQSCNECNSLCFTPPNSFVFELVDGNSKENVFTNNTYSSDDIKVVNTADNKIVAHNFISENNKNLLSIHTIGWKTEKVTLAVKLANETIFTLFVDASRLDGDCCSFTKYNEIRIENANYEFNSSTGIYQILLN